MGEFTCSWSFSEEYGKRREEKGSEAIYKRVVIAMDHKVLVIKEGK